MLQYLQIKQKLISKHWRNRFLFGRKKRSVAKLNGVVSLVKVFEKLSHGTSPFWARDKVNWGIRLIHEQAFELTRRGGIGLCNILVVGRLVWVLLLSYLTPLVFFLSHLIIAGIFLSMIAVKELLKKRREEAKISFNFNLISFGIFARTL